MITFHSWERLTRMALTGSNKRSFNQDQILKNLGPLSQ